MYKKEIHHENDLLKGKNDWCMCDCKNDKSVIQG